MVYIHLYLELWTPCGLAVKLIMLLICYDCSNSPLKHISKCCFLRSLLAYLPSLTPLPTEAILVYFTRQRRLGLRPSLSGFWVLYNWSNGCSYKNFIADCNFALEPQSMCTYYEMLLRNDKTPASVLDLLSFWSFGLGWKLIPQLKVSINNFVFVRLWLYSRS